MFTPLEIFLFIFVINLATIQLGSGTYCGEIINPEDKSWPWHVALHSSDSSYIAGGSIISEWFVLTAAQVTYVNGTVPRKPNELQVVMGVGDLSVSKKVTVSKIIRYEKFNPQTRSNDLALLKLETIIEFSAHISSVCLWPSVEPSFETLAAQGQQGVVLGWRWDSEGGAKYVSREAYVPAGKIERCPVPSENDSSMKKSYCITSSSESVSTGSGMFFQIDNVWHMRGIVSQRLPTVDTKNTMMVDITYYQKWIEKHALPKQHNLLGLEDCGLGSYEESKESEQQMLVVNHHPWIAHLAYLFWGRFNVSDCHGVLIHPEFVVTSATCTDSRDYRKLLHVILGESSIGRDPYSSKMNNLQAVKVSEHLFSRIVKTSEDIFDINILRLAKNVILTETVKPVCLPPIEEVVPYYSMTAWYRGDEHPKELKTSLMRLAPFDQCRLTYLEKGINFTSDDLVACFEPCQLSETQKCESTPTRNCTRSLSASPIFYTQHDGVNTHTYLAALRSFGTENCHDGLHDVFNDIVSFRFAIETLVDEKAWFADDDYYLSHDYEPAAHTIYYELDDDGNMINEDESYKVSVGKVRMGSEEEDGNRNETEKYDEP